MKPRILYYVGSRPPSRESILFYCTYDFCRGHENGYYSTSLQDAKHERRYWEGPANVYKLSVALTVKADIINLNARTPKGAV